MIECIVLISCKYKWLSFICLKTCIWFQSCCQGRFATDANSDKSQNQKHSSVALISLSRLFVCTLSGGFIQHPCPARLTSYFLYYSLSTFWSEPSWALESSLSSIAYHFCVIRRLCLTQIKVIHPLFKWYQKQVRDITSWAQIPLSCSRQQ